MSEGFEARPSEGVAPASIRVLPSERGAPRSVAGFVLEADVGGKPLRAQGTISHLRWSVRWWAWAADPREGEAAWRKTVDASPLAAADGARLDFAGAGPPNAGVPADRFATVAETRIDVSRGDYVLRVVSDDGVRVFVDGAPVFADWTWHGPKEDAIRLPLTDGPHDLRIEHFEIDGYAALRAVLEPGP